MSATKAKIRKSEPKSYLQNSALCTFNLCYSLHRKSETIFVKLLMFQWSETRNIHASRNHFCYWFCLSPPSLPLWVHGILRFPHLFINDQAQIISGTVKKIRKESVFRGRHLHLIKPNILRIYSFRVFFFIMYRTKEIDILTINAPQPLTTWLYVFENIYHHYELFNYLIHLISERI